MCGADPRWTGSPDAVRPIWVSKSATLIEDATRDWTDLGGSPADIQPLSKWKPDQPIPMGDGILFVTYATLRSAGKCGTTRLSQIFEWMGEDFEGVLAFDEAHAMQNAAGSEQCRGVKPSQQGLAGLRLQLAAPRARVFYISATGATSVHNLAYAARLGLWGAGPGIPLPEPREFRLGNGGGRRCGHGGGGPRSQDARALHGPRPQL